MLEFFVGFGSTVVGLMIVVLVIVAIKWMVDSGFMEFLVIIGFWLFMLWAVVQVSRETGKWVMETGTEQVRSYLNENP